MPRLHGVEALSDEDAAHRRHRFAERLFVRARHLAHDVRFLAIGAKPFADALDLRTVAVEACAFLGVNSDAQLLPVSADELDVLLVSCEFALRDEEGAVHALRLHFLQDFTQRRFLRQAAEREDDGGFRGAHDALLLGDASLVLPAQRGIGAACSCLPVLLLCRRRLFCIVKELVFWMLLLRSRDLKSGERRESRRFEGCCRLRRPLGDRCGCRAAAKSSEQETNGAQSALFP